MDEGAAGELGAPRWEKLSIFMLITSAGDEVGLADAVVLLEFEAFIGNVQLDIAQWENLSILNVDNKKSVWTEMSLGGA